MKWWAWPFLLLVLLMQDFYENGRITWHITAGLLLEEMLADFQVLPDYAVDGSSLPGRVAKIADGDTLTLRTDDGHEAVIRLYGIDAPERDQPYGSESRRLLSQMIYGEPVTVMVQDRDNYGRLVGRIQHQGEDVNLILVSAGAAWWYQDYARSDDALRRAQEQARVQALGLWADPAPEAPWEWRRRN